MKKWQICLAVALCAATNLGGRERSGAATQNQSSFEVTMVARTITVINYEHRGGSTQIGFRARRSCPTAKARQKWKASKAASRSMRIFKSSRRHNYSGRNISHSYSGALRPRESRTTLAKYLLDGDRSKISVTTSLQTFGLIVTAEPYFAVSTPSNAVVLENIVLPGTVGTIEQASAKYQSLDKGIYNYDFSAASSRYAKPKSKTPLELDEARNAVEIAKAANAQQYAPDAFGRAQTSLNQAESLFTSKGDKKRVIQAARDAVQNAADARTTAVKREYDEKVAREKAAAAAAEAAAKADAAASERAKQQAEIQRLQAGA